MNSSLLFQVIVLTLFKNILCADKLKIQYYEEIIKEGIDKANSYQPPDRNEDFEPGSSSNTSKHYGTFDFIIVGAGSTGNVIATRLSEIQSWKILLLEAGGEESDFSDIPRMSANLSHSDMNWGYRTVPQKYICFSTNDNRCSISRGKVIGGTSTINGAHYTRGNAKDFDKWAAMGLTNWSFKEVIKYFKKSENSQINGDEFYHGKGGYLNVEFPKPEMGTLSSFFEASGRKGQSYVDLNGREQLGVSKFQQTTRGGVRQSTGRAFLSNARQRNNLKVTISALVTKIIVDDDTTKVKKARGVYFVKNGKKFRVFARKEVILSAGAYNSPQILMLSGIGPENHLQEVGVKVLVNLPAVGNNLIDDVATILKFHINQTFQQMSLTEQIRKFLKGTGPLTRSSSIDGISYLKLKSSVGQNLPNIEIQYGVDNNLAIFPVTVKHSKSRGSITLKSNNPIDFPLIDPNMLSDAKNEDESTLLDGIKYVLELTETQAFRRLNATFKPTGFNNFCNKHSSQLDEHFWRCYIRHNIYAPCHVCGTTRMGISRIDSVVDQNLKVHGVEGLRVADAGVFPTSVSGHINAVVIMVGEMVSDIVKVQYGGF